MTHGSVSAYQLTQYYFHLASRPKSATAYYGAAAATNADENISAMKNRLNTQFQKK